MDDNIFKIATAAIAAFFSYCVYAVKRGISRQDKLEQDMADSQIKLNVFDEQVKHILDKLEDVVKMGERLEVSNRTILRALARKSRNSSK